VVEQQVNQRFENHLCFRHDEDRDDDSRDGSRNVGLLAVQPPDAAASQSKLYWIQSSEMWCGIAQYVVTNVSSERLASIFKDLITQRRRAMS
jgi:hypothetical protein